MNWALSKFFRKNKSTKSLSSFHLFFSSFQISFGVGIVIIKLKKKENSDHLTKLKLLLSVKLMSEKPVSLIACFTIDLLKQVALTALKFIVGKTSS